MALDRPQWLADLSRGFVSPCSYLLVMVVLPKSA
jgi:hypothetical protein